MPGGVMVLMRPCTARVPLTCYVLAFDFLQEQIRTAALIAQTTTNILPFRKSLDLINIKCCIPFSCVIKLHPLGAHNPWGTAAYNNSALALLLRFTAFDC